METDLHTGRDKETQTDRQADRLTDAHLKLLKFKVIDTDRATVMHRP